jgi:hypothetical protein
VGVLLCRRALAIDTPCSAMHQCRARELTRTGQESRRGPPFRPPPRAGRACGEGSLPCPGFVASPGPEWPRGTRFRPPAPGSRHSLSQPCRTETCPARRGENPTPRGTTPPIPIPLAASAFVSIALSTVALASRMRLALAGALSRSRFGAERPRMGRDPARRRQQIPPPAASVSHAPRPSPRRRATTTVQ